MALTTIGDRLTPSNPIEQTFDAQTASTGTKITTLIGHMAADGTAAANSTYLVTKIADADAAKREVDLMAGQDSQIGKMAYAFVAANSLAGRSTFPAFRVMLLANDDGGIDNGAVEILKRLRSDMIVSPYKASLIDANQELLDLVIQISGPDRDLQGQFGSFLTVGSTDNIQAVQAYTWNSQKLIIASLPDSASGVRNVVGNSVQGSPVLSNCSTTLGVLPGQDVSCAVFSGNVKVVSVDSANRTITLTANANEDADSVLCNVFTSGVSQAPEIIAAAHAGAVMASVFPYNPLNGVKVGGLIPPVKMADRVEIDPFGSSEALLKAGVSPLYCKPDGSVALLKTRTTYKLLGDGVTEVRDYNAWQQLVTLNDFREELYQICQNPPFNNNPGGTKASLSVAQALLGEFVRLALSFEDQGAFQGVKSLVKLFQVEPSKLRRGRFDFKLPVNVLPDLDVIAINIFSTTMFDFTL